MPSWDYYLNKLASIGESFYLLLRFGNLNIKILQKKDHSYTGYNNSEHISVEWCRSIPIAYEEQHR